VLEHGALHRPARVNEPEALRHGGAAPARRQCHNGGGRSGGNDHEDPRSEVREPPAACTAARLLDQGFEVLLVLRRFRRRFDDHQRSRGRRAFANAIALFGVKSDGARAKISTPPWVSTTPEPSSASTPGLGPWR
jgi:hypothetical protein